MPYEVNDAASFLRAIKEVTNEDHDADAILYLENETDRIIQAISSSGYGSPKQMRIAYYQGAFLGLKIAAARNRQEAARIAHERGIDLETGKAKKKEVEN